MPQHTLYLCYFGLREPLVQTQVLPYLREIKKLDEMKISLLTFETKPKDAWTAKQIEDEKRQLAAEDIEWDFLTYHKTPSAPATLFDVVCGAYFIWKKRRHTPVDILHARVHVPAMMGAIAKKLSGNRIKLIFDIRGFFPEEYTDAGNWKENGLLYKTVKRVEKWLFKASDGFVVLTEKARSILFPESAATGFDKFGRPIEVIPCCVNLQRFAVAADEDARREIRRRLNLENRRVITYTGSLGTWYLADEMADLLQAARDADASTFALILTQSSGEIMAEKLKARGFSENDFLVRKVPHSEVPEYLSAADAAISFIKPCYSKLSSSPTKIAEYLASGLPIITNRGVGDVAEQIEADRVGEIVEEFSRESYNNALRALQKLSATPEIKERCRRSAKKRFDLETIGGARYRRFYEKVIAREIK